MGPGKARGRRGGLRQRTTLDLPLYVLRLGDVAVVGNAVRAVFGNRPADSREVPVPSDDPLRLYERVARIRDRLRQHGRSRVHERVLPLHEIPSRPSPNRPATSWLTKQARFSGHLGRKRNRPPWRTKCSARSARTPGLTTTWCSDTGSRETRFRYGVGAYAIIRSGSILYADTTVGERFSCGHQALVRGRITIGDRVVVHHKVTLEGNLEIGSGVKIMAHVYLPSRTRIGDRVFIGPGTTVLNDKRPMRDRTELAGVTVEDHVTIGGGVTVCPGVTIGTRSFIAAGAVVTKNVPPNTLAIGSPARFQPLPEAPSPPATSRRTCCRKRICLGHTRMIRGGSSARSVPVRAFFRQGILRSKCICQGILPREGRNA